jgi:hypothetical protein
VSPPATHTRGWLTHSIAVIPAKRGEAEFSRTHLTCVRAAERVQRVLLHPGQQQALNSIARCARDSQKLCAGGSAPAPWVTFFARAKKARPRMARHPTCASRRNRRSPQLAGRTQRASGSNTRLAAPDSGCDARARHTGDFKTHLIDYSRVTHGKVFQTPHNQNDKKH